MKLPGFRGDDEEPRLGREEREFVQAVKDAKRMKRGESMGKLLKLFGNAVPRGIRSPDSTVRNIHLYVPGRKGKTRLY